MRLLKQESKIRKMQMAVVHAHSGRMGPCQFSWLPSEAPDCGFIEARKLWGCAPIKRGKGIPLCRATVSPLEGGAEVQSKCIIN